MIVKGKICSTGGKYKNGNDRLEIRFSTSLANNLPIYKNQRNNIELKINEKIYTIGISHTDNNTYIWINPDCILNGTKYRLSNILNDLGLKKNDDIFIDFTKTLAVIVIDKETIYLPEELDNSTTYHEGSFKQIIVNAYERNAKARRKCIEHYGNSCIICGFNFLATNGPEADGFIHVHHIKPLSEINEQYEVDPIKDLRPLCPNCHAFVHLGGKCRDINEIKITKSA